MNMDIHIENRDMGVLGLITVILLGTGAYVYLQETGSYKNCGEGWELMETGQYFCASRDMTEWCYSLSSSGYRCYLGTPVYPEPDEPEPPVYDPGTGITTRGSYWYTTSPDGETCYLWGNLRYKNLCSEVLA